MIDQGTIRAMIKRFTGPLAALIPSGTASAATYLRGDGAWVDPFPNGQLRARVNFNGTGTVAIREAANVASITDLGTGQYRVNFTNALATANYTVGHSVSSFNTTVVVRLLTTTSVQIEVRDLAGTLTDADTVCVAVFQ